MTCWFCGKETAEEGQNIRLKFERFNYADKVAQGTGERPDRLSKVMVVGRCKDCLAAHRTYNRISLLAILPGAVLAYSIFLLFRKVNPNLVFLAMAVSLIGFGAVLVTRVRYLKKRGVKALVELEMKNDEIQDTLASGWYRI